MAKTTNIPYTPDLWNDDQRAVHTPETMDEAFHSASCLASGWYRRPVTIDFRVVNLDEEYMIRPSDVPPLDGWRPCYTVTAHSTD